MNNKPPTGRTGLFFKVVISSLCLVAASLPVHAKKKTDDITLIEMGDLHATIVSHQAVLKAEDGSEYYSYDAGGMAKLKAKVDEIRGENPNSLLLSVGDLTHGSAEGLFTVGDAVMAVMNQFDIDVFTPGNWDFGYGPAVYRNRFTPATAPVPGNIAVMAGYIYCGSFGGIPNCSESSGIIKMKFPVSAINLYNVSPPLPGPAHNKRVHPKNFELFEMDGATVAVIGITAAIVPQAADTFNIGLRFTQGVEELPVAIAEAKAAGATIIVVQSELGLSQNLELARRFHDIDVMYSAHTHEVTSGVLLADAEGVLRTTPGGPLSGEEQSRLSRGAAIVVETNRDMYVGRLDLKISDGKISAFNWKAIPIDESVEADEEDIVTQLVALVEELFTGDDVDFTFMPGGFCPGTPPNPPTSVCGDISERGLRLTDSLETVVGQTAANTVLLRHHVLEDVLNDFIADAIYTVTNRAVMEAGIDGWTQVDLSMTNGFRFGNAVLPESPITLRDLYTWFPVGPAVNVADFSGASVQKGLDEILGAVFDRNVFQQRGGWYLGLANMTQTIDLKNRPFSSSSGRIVKTMVGGVPLDPSKRYVFASCYAHGDPIDQVCRTSGGANHHFFELADANNYASTLTVVPPVNDENIIVGTVIKQVAPDRFLHPVHILRRYLDGIGNTVDSADYSIHRVKTVDSTVLGNPVEPESDQIGQPDNTPDPTLVQPPFGAGPKFFSGRVGDGI